MQYIGKLMRKVDADALAQAIELDAVAHRQPELVAPKLQRVWAEKLLDADAGAAALQQFIADQPQADIQQLRSLLRQAKKLQTSARELQNAQPPQPDKAYAEYRAAKRAAKKLQAFIAQVLGHDEPEDDEDGENGEGG
jgi:ribosome-associated protein